MYQPIPTLLAPGQNVMGGQNLSNIASMLKQPQQNPLISQMSQNNFGTGFSKGFQQAQQQGRGLGMGQMPSLGQTSGQAMPGQGAPGQGPTPTTQAGSFITPNQAYPYGYNAAGVPTGVDPALNPLGDGSAPAMDLTGSGGLGLGADASAGLGSGVADASAAGAGAVGGGMADIGAAGAAGAGALGDATALLGEGGGASAGLLAALFA